MSWCACNHIAETPTNICCARINATAWFADWSWQFGYWWSWNWAHGPVLMNGASSGGITQLFTRMENMQSAEKEEVTWVSDSTFPPTQIQMNRINILGFAPLFPGWLLWSRGTSAIFVIRFLCSGLSPVLNMTLVYLSASCWHRKVRWRLCCHLFAGWRSSLWCRASAAAGPASVMMVLLLTLDLMTWRMLTGRTACTMWDITFKMWKHNVHFIYKKKKFRELTLAFQQ